MTIFVIFHFFYSVRFFSFVSIENILFNSLTSLQCVNSMEKHWRKVFFFLQFFCFIYTLICIWMNRVKECSFNRTVFYSCAHYASWKFSVFLSFESPYFLAFGTPFHTNKMLVWFEAMQRIFYDTYRQYFRISEMLLICQSHESIQFHAYYYFSRKKCIFWEFCQENMFQSMSLSMYIIRANSNVIICWHCWHAFFSPFSSTNWASTIIL